jgi:hypothetical protein
MFSWADSEVWFNTPQLAAAQIRQRLQKFGIKADDIINFLSNEPPIQKWFCFSDTVQLAARRFIKIYR